MRRFVASCSAVLLALVVLGACGGDSAKTSANTSDPSDTKASETTSPDDGTGSGNDFAQRYADATKARFKITYTTNDGDPQTYAQDGKGNSVYGDGNSQYFRSSSGSVLCTTDSDGKASCGPAPGGASVSPFLALFNAGQGYIQVLGNFADTESKSVAGRDAECVTFSKDTAKGVGAVGAAIAAAIEGSLTYCVDKETGVLLESSTTDESGTTTDSFKVTKFETPTDADFTPPTTPASLPL